MPRDTDPATTAAWYPRRIAFAGDWHGNTPYAVTAIHMAATLGAEIILHTGDFGYQFTPAYLDTLTQALTDHHLDLWFVDGNHDNHDYLAARPTTARGLRWLTPTIAHIPRGHRWTWNGTRFLGLGGAHSVDRTRRTPGLDWWPEEYLSTTDITTAIAGGAADVMLTHDCPAGVDIPHLMALGWPPEDIRTADHHRHRLAQAVLATQPRLLVHGHYHRRYSAPGPGVLRHYCRVEGLDCDGTPLTDNLLIADLTGLTVPAHPATPTPTDQP